MPIVAVWSIVAVFFLDGSGPGVGPGGVTDVGLLATLSVPFLDEAAAVFAAALRGGFPRFVTAVRAGHFLAEYFLAAPWAEDEPALGWLHVEAGGGHRLCSFGW